MKKSVISANLALIAFLVIVFSEVSMFGQNERSASNSIFFKGPHTLPAKKAVLDHYQLIRSNLQKITTATNESKDEHRNCAREAYLHLKQVKQQFKRETMNHKYEPSRYISSIKKHHKNAMKGAILLIDELKITYPNQEKMLNYAKQFDEAIQSAEKEYLLLKAKANN